MALSKKVIHPTEKSQPLSEVLTDGHELNLFLDAVLDCRINDVGLEESLVEWKKLPEFESSWEEGSVITEIFQIPPWGQGASWWEGYWWDTTSYYKGLLENKQGKGE